MNKDRLELCKSFTNAKTIADIEYETDRAYWQNKEDLRKLNRDLNNFLRALAYQKRPWYKKIFD